MLNLVAIAALTAITTADPTWEDIVQKNFKDCVFTAKVVKGNQTELKKINKDFAISYRFKFMNAKVKEPYKVRLDSEVDDTMIVYLLVGTKKSYVIPGKIRASEDVADAPGKRQTVRDFGILTPSLFRDYLKADYVRTDRESGDYVFDLTYKEARWNDTSRHRVWIDPQQKYIKKRVWYAQEGHLLATFLYENPKNEDGVWFPTKCTVKNAEDKVAGVTEYSSMKINVGLADSVFKL